MKKILSFVLVLAMIASMMCINASAALIVGSGEGQNKVGVESNWTTSDNTSIIQAAVQGSTTPKYAVDLVYAAKNIFIQSDLTWDVNTLHYEGTAYVAIADARPTNKPTAENLNGWTALQDGADNKVTGIGEFIITNYSCESVFVTAAVDCTPNVAQGSGYENNGSVEIVTVLHENQSNLDNQGLVYIAQPVTVTDTVASEIEGVDDYTVNQGGTVNVKTYAADMYCEDWAQALHELSTDTSATLIIASITFTIAPAN